MFSLLKTITTLALGSAAFQQAFAASFIIPDNDPFYQPPAGFESSPPGTVLKDRPSTSGTNGINAIQILYRTTDAIGRAAATVATILIGNDSSPNKLVAYNYYEDSANSSCAPSYQFNNGSGQDVRFGWETLQGVLSGWTVVMPDYQGFDSAFAAGHLEGYAVLDSLRATLNYAPAKVSKTASLGAIGYSGGAIATGWAAALHKTYAPELNVKGFVFGGTPANLTSTLLNVDGTQYAGYAAAGIAGMIAAYPQLNDVFNRIATPAGLAAVAQIRAQCSGADITGYNGVHFLSTEYQSLGANLLSDPTIQAVLALNILGTNVTETPVVPVLMFHGAKDQVIPYVSAKAAAAAWCANGANVAFVSVQNSGHVGTEFAYGPNSAVWLDQRLKGIKPAGGCPQSNAAGWLPVKRKEAMMKQKRYFGGVQLTDA